MTFDPNLLPEGTTVSTSGGPAMLTREQLAALLAVEMTIRGADVMTVEKSRLETLTEELGLTVTELEHVYILTVTEDRDSDATDPPSDQFPTT